MKIVGVTACPTGIATYMSAEKLEVTARNPKPSSKIRNTRCKTENQLSEQRNQRGRCNHSCSR